MLFASALLSLVPAFGAGLVVSESGQGALAAASDDAGAPAFEVGAIGAHSENYLALASGWSIRVRAPNSGEGVWLEWFEPDAVLPSENANFETPVDLAGGSLESVTCAGPAGMGRLIVGGVGSDGQGRLMVFRFEAQDDPSALDGDEPLREAVVFQKVFVVDRHASKGRPFDGEGVPKGVLPLHGVAGHALILLGGAMGIFDFDMEADGAAAEVRQVMTLAEAMGGAWWSGSIQWHAVRSEIDCMRGPRYWLLSDTRSCVAPSFVCLDDPLGRGDLKPANWDDLLIGEEQQEGQGALTPRYSERSGVPMGHFGLGPKSMAHAVRNMDLLRTASGAAADVQVKPGFFPRTQLQISWQTEGGELRPLEPGALPVKSPERYVFDVQTFDMGAEVVTFGAMDNGRLAVSTIDLESGVGRLELYSIPAPVKTKLADGSVQVVFQEPRHLRTVHEAAPVARERIVMVFQNKAKADHAFVLLGDSSTLCEVNLLKSRTAPKAVLTTAQQQALIGKFSVVHSVIYESGLPGYFLSEAGTGSFGAPESRVTLTLLDRDGDGSLDGNGYDSGNKAQQAEFDPFLQSFKGERGPRFIEFAGQPMK